MAPFGFPLNNPHRSKWRPNFSAPQAVGFFGGFPFSPQGAVLQTTSNHHRSGSKPKGPWTSPPLDGPGCPQSLPPPPSGFETRTRRTAGGCSLVDSKELSPCQKEKVGEENGQNQSSSPIFHSRKPILHSIFRHCLRGILDPKGRGDPRVKSVAILFSFCPNKNKERVPNWPIST